MKKDISKFDDAFIIEVAQYIMEEYDLSEPLTSDIELTGKYEKVSSYTIKFNSNGGSSVASQSVLFNQKVTEPVAPTKEAFIFDGWYLNNTKYDFLGLFFSLIGKQTKDGLKTKQVCSTFVYSLLKSIDIDFANKATNLIKPDDLIAKDRDKQFVVYKGKIKDVDQNNIYRK